MSLKINTYNKIILGLLLMATTIAYGQSGNIAINSSGNSPNSSAILDLSSNTNGGFLLPSLTTGQISSLSPVSNSLLVYNSTSTCYEQYYSSCSCWQVVFCPCNNAPAAPTTLSGNTAPCASSASSATYPYTVSAVNDATSYSWTITDVGGGCPTDTWTGFVGNGGTSMTGSPTTQDITWWQDCSYTVSVAAVNACGTSAAITLAITVASSGTTPAPTVTGPATICTNSTLNTYTASSPGASVYTWTVPAAVGTISSGAGTATITVTGAAGAGSGTISVTGTGCSTSAATTLAVTVSGAPSAPTLAGPTTITATSTGNTYTATSAGATSFTWTVPASVGTIASGQGTATITVTGAGGSGSGNITATATGTCGTSGSSANYGVTVGSCGTITADANAASGDGTNSFTITTTVPNDLVIVSCNGHGNAFNGSVSIVPPSGSVPTVTQYASIADNGGSAESALALYYFVAPTAGVYTINVYEGSNWGVYYANFAVALTGFCGTPSGANIQNPASTYYAGDCYNAQTGISASLTEIAGSYAIGSFTDFWCSTQAVPAWTNLTSISGTFDQKDTYTFAGQAIAVAATPTITVAQSGNEGFCVLYLIDVH
jgi:hypothetical protein